VTKKRKASTKAQAELIEPGIRSAEELAAPTPRRDPVECVLEDARDFKQLWSSADWESDDSANAHDLIDRLANLLEISHGLLLDYMHERDLARKLLDEVRLARLIERKP
jgi:hypothetical protein